MIVHGIQESEIKGQYRLNKFLIFVFYFIILLINIILVRRKTNPIMIDDNMSKF